MKLQSRQVEVLTQRIKNINLLCGDLCGWIVFEVNLVVQPLSPRNIGFGTHSGAGNLFIGVNGWACRGPARWPHTSAATAVGPTVATAAAASAVATAETASTVACTIASAEAAAATVAAAETASTASTAASGTIAAASAASAASRASFATAIHASA